jgi:uncharacterized protein (TIGR03790 family)
VVRSVPGISSVPEISGISLLLLFLAVGVAHAQGPENVLVVVNDSSAVSKSIGEYYALRRGIPLKNICHLDVKPEEDIRRGDYDEKIALRIRAYLDTNHLREKILYIVTTSGVPLRVSGKYGLDGDCASVDSELTLLYQPGPHRTAGSIPNPFFGQKNAKFEHRAFPIYLVTRLTGYSFEDVKAIVDRSLAATNRGTFVIDLRSSNDDPGNDWLRSAALALPANRVIFDESNTVLYGLKDVIGYASWGSNDSHRKRRHLGFQWLPGAIATEFVSTNARTFTHPPDSWNIGSWNDAHSTMFFDSPQTLTADYLHDGATGASGSVDEPYLHLNPRPDLLLPAYYRGRNLAESYYLSIPALSWMTVVVGDPLCSLGKP